jgi:hypothetical protein
MLASPRAVGRKRLPTTVIGLLTHISDHRLRERFVLINYYHQQCVGGSAFAEV